MPKHIILNASIAIIAVIITSLLGSYFTNQGLKDKQWYASIKHPWTPPSYVFPIVWTILYVMIAYGFFMALESKQIPLIALYILNLALNVIWCYLYFAKKLDDDAFITLIMLWLTTAVMIDTQRSFILVPYIAWLSFATILSWRV
jgi:translocator protein